MIYPSQKLKMIYEANFHNSLLSSISYKCMYPCLTIMSTVPMNYFPTDQTDSSKMHILSTNGPIPVTTRIMHHGVH